MGTLEQAEFLPSELGLCHMALFLPQIQRFASFVPPQSIMFGDSIGRSTCQGDLMPACLPECLSLAMLQLIQFPVAFATAEKRSTGKSTKAIYEILGALEQCMRHNLVYDPPRTNRPRTHHGVVKTCEH